MRMKYILLLATCFFCGFSTLLAQKVEDKYWVLFNDKPAVESVSIETVLSKRAIERRERQGIALHTTDFPVNPSYIQQLEASGVTILQRSKWLNGVSVRINDSQAEGIAQLPFVRSVKPISKVIVEYDAPDLSLSKFGYNTGYTKNQLNMIGLDKMHQNGFNGKGVLISVMDNGFHDADKNPALQHLFGTNRIVATHDFVNNETDVFNEGDHGQWVLTILAGWLESTDDPNYWFYGSAHGASFILCQTEDNTQEVHQEEDNWLAAMEYADSIGADIFSTSLGYRNFDNGDDYGLAGLDGNTTIITNAADLAASKGILVFNAAGNQGQGKLLAPADGDSVIAVGAVDSARVIAGFSSRGPTADGRIKPDISTMGSGTSFIRSTGLLSRGSGTSFSCPVAAGMAACILQSAPNTPNMVMYDAIIRSADRYENPDTNYGYGIPYAPTAYRILNGKELPGVLGESALSETGMGIFPNPALDHFNLVIDNDEIPWEGAMELIDMGGRLLWKRELSVASFYNVFEFNRADDFAFVPSGVYGLRVRDISGNVLHSSKITLLNQR